MKRAAAILLPLVIIFISCGDDAADKAKEYALTATKEVTALNHQYDSLSISADTAKLNRIYADEFTCITPEGGVRNKAQQLTNIASGGLKMEFGKSDDVQVSVYDSTAVLTGRFTGKGTFMQNFVNINERYTTVWTKKAGKWMLVKKQSTYIK